MGFGLSQDDIYAVANRRGVEMTDEESSRWFNEIDHGLVEMAALQADDMDEQTTLAFDAIDSQLDELGCWDPQKAEQTAAKLSGQTASANASRTRRV